VECIEDSIAINISLVGASYSEIVCSGLQQLLWGKREFRQSVKGGVGYCHGGGDGENRNKTEARAVVTSILKEIPVLLKALDASDFLPEPCFLQKSRELTMENDDKEEEKDEEEEDDSDDEEKEEEDCDESEEGSEDESPIDAGSIEPLHDIEKHRFRVNPLAQVLSGTDLERLGWEYRGGSGTKNAPSADNGFGGGSGDAGGGVSGEFYVVHCSFGNETLESLSRRCVFIPVSMIPLMKSIFDNRKEWQTSFKVNELNGKSFSGSGTAKLARGLAPRLVTALYEAGALTKL